MKDFSDFSSRCRNLSVAWRDLGQLPDALIAQLLGAERLLSSGEAAAHSLATGLETAGEKLASVSVPVRKATASAALTCSACETRSPGHDWKSHEAVIAREASERKFVEALEAGRR